LAQSSNYNLDKNQRTALFIILYREMFSPKLGFDKEKLNLIINEIYGPEVGNTIEFTPDYRIDMINKILNSISGVQKNLVNVEEISPELSKIVIKVNEILPLFLPVFNFDFSENKNEFGEKISAFGHRIERANMQISAFGLGTSESADSASSIVEQPLIEGDYKSLLYGHLFLKDFERFYPNEIRIQSKVLV
jgi:hypothetical protein